MSQNLEVETIEMPKYKCHKVVRAFQIGNIRSEPEGNHVVLVPDDFRVAQIMVDGDYMEKHSPVVGGYYVLHDDGHDSYLSAEAFEAGYALM